MRRFIVLISITMSLFLSFSCAPVRTIVPLEKGDTHVSATAGGPLIKFSGLVIPMPLTSVCVAHGLGNNATLNSALHTTSLLFGVIQIEESVTTRLYSFSDKGFGITTTPGFYFMTDLWKGKVKFYPFQDISVYGCYGENMNFMYLSYTHLLEISSRDSYGNTPSFGQYVPNVSIGHTWRRPKVNYTLEFKYMSFLKSNENIVVDYISPSSKGTLAFQLGLTKKF